MTDNGSAPRSVAGAWQPDLPAGLVVACSDGRHQEQFDGLLRALGVEAYDRVYVPGGPGALAVGGGEFTRAHRVRSECLFLIEAHKLEHVFLFFHGPAPGGPAAAICGDYQRKMSGGTAADIARQQEADAAELVRGVFPSHLSLHLYRIEVLPDASVHLVRLDAEGGPRSH